MYTSVKPDISFILKLTTTTHNQYFLYFQSSYRVSSDPIFLYFVLSKLLQDVK
jgi:hypothetical protein